MADSLSATVLDDVVQAFEAIPRTGLQWRAEAGNAIAAPRYSARLDNRLGFRNHFQGALRIPGTDYLVVSGSDPRDGLARLFVTRVPELVRGGRPAGNRPPAARIESSVDLEPELWHAGGLAGYGTLLAVPVYGGDPRRGRVLFFDMRAPNRPRRLPTTVERPGRKAYAVALTRERDGRLLLAVLAGRDGLPQRLDLYLSRGSRLASGFVEPLTWHADDIRGGAGQSARFSDYQSLAFLRQTDGSLFLAGLHNTAPSMEILPGRDYADLFEVQLERDREGTRLQAATITKVANRHLVCEAGYCNLDAAAGLYVGPSGDLAIYATSFWLDGGDLKLTEFSANPR